VLRILITALVTLALAALALVGTGRIQEKHALEFATNATRDIYENWDYEAVHGNAVAELRDNAEFNEQGPKMMRWGQEVLGPLERLGAPSGGLAFRWGANVAMPGVVGQYTFDSRFSRGEARLEIEVIRESGEWRMTEFRFNSPQLIGSVPNFSGTARKDAARD
jgi:hypothetical protein